MARRLTVLLRVGIVAGAVLAAHPGDAWADCASDCKADYDICTSGGGWDTQRSCSVDLSTCTQKCVFHSQRHGAIAYSSKQHVHGYSFDYDSSGAAEKAAVRFCRQQQRDADDCRVLVTFHNACGALARGDRGAVGSAWGLSKGEASAKALDACRSRGGQRCKIEREVCTGNAR